ncbi:MAG: glycosyl hydrolase, partial [Bacteroidota bacterium]
WNRLGIDEGKLRCFFHDSFEYTGDFTPGFLEEFKARRGYNLTKYLHVLAGDCQSKETVTRVKSDYRQTLSDLVLESFIKPMTDWANNHKSLNRNQAHGSPGNILDLYAACDIPETEIFQRLNQGSPDVFVNKFASSAAHVTGQKLVSSESYTWLEEHWTVTTSDLVKATNRFFLAGINHMFFHGTCYSPEDAPWPGWLFYASTQMNNRNPFWREMPALFKYIERTQTVLQKSNSQSDILIYWPYFDVAASEGRIFNHLGVNKDAGWFNSHPISELSESLTNSGYTFDYISDKQLDDCQLLNNEIITSGDAVYKAIVIPQSEYIPVKTMQKLSEFIQSGGKVIFDKSLPKSVPGMHNLEERIQLMEQLKTGMPQNNVGDVGEKLVELQVEGEKDLADKGFHYLKMRLDGEIFYLIFNTTSEKIDEWVKINHPSKSFIFMNPMNGLISKAGSKGKKVRIQLNPEEIVFIKCLDKNVNVKPHIYFEENLTQQEIKGHWKVVFEEGGPVYPGNIDIKELKSWTEAGDAETQRFAGTTRYTINFEWDGSNSGFLNLGDVRDCAHVYVNDKDFGTLPGPTFSVYVDNLKKGSNKLEIEVTNVAANRIRDLDKRGVVWRKFYDINFVNIDYKPFDASGWVVREAGLLGPVTLLSHPE